MHIPILFEDQDVMVINKPSGVVVNCAHTLKEETVQDWFTSHIRESTDWQSMVPSDFLSEYGTPEEVFRERGGVVHRLDKETSGVMVLAKNPGALAELLRQFRLRQTLKKYTCLVHGKFQILSGTLTLPLVRSPWNRTKFTVAADGRTAETHYQVTKFFPMLDTQRIFQEKKLPHFLKNARKAYQGFSLVECQPKTGRTHQIRVHMSHIKHPIVNDPTYLGKKRQTLDNVWCPRLFLHASSLTFTHPRTKESMTFSTELPLDLMTALEYCHE